MIYHTVGNIWNSFQSVEYKCMRLYPFLWWKIIKILINWPYQKSSAYMRGNRVVWFYQYLYNHTACDFFSTPSKIALLKHIRRASLVNLPSAMYAWDWMRLRRLVKRSVAQTNSSDKTLSYRYSSLYLQH